MKVMARPIRADENEQEVTQRDQFNTDAVGLAETLVREAHQNSVDGHSKAHGLHVRTRVRILRARESDQSKWLEILEPLTPHLEACGLKLSGIDLGRPRLLVIEDFGTTGLLGATEKKDNDNFSDFWRRTGRSHKHGEAGGRWGLGKLVFSSSSKIRTFFGITVQEADAARTPLLMGQAVLRHHKLEEQDYAPHVFFANSGVGGLQVPERGGPVVEWIMKACGLDRGSEPGLSIVVPHLHEEITTESMLPHLIRNWFFPILTGHLVVELGEHTLDANTFEELARSFGGSEFADGSRVAFIRELHNARASAPSTCLSADWTKNIESCFQTAELERLRTSFADGDLVSVRLPLAVKRQTGASQPTYIDVYLRSAPHLVRGEAFYVRGAITIPGEARRFSGRQCFGALIADHPVIASFLGDAEGPAHTTWSGTAEKVRDNWKNPSERLREVRESLNRLYELIARVDDRSDADALKNFLYVNRSADKPTAKKPLIKKPKPPKDIPRKAPSYRVEQRKGGFMITGTTNTEIPMTMRVQVAYDVAQGKPLSEFDPLDFDITKSDIKVKTSKVEYTPIAANEFKFVVHEPGFQVALSGFDENRDLFVYERKL